MLFLPFSSLMRLKRRKCVPSCSSRSLRVDEDEIYRREKRAKEESVWAHRSSQVISQLARCFVGVVANAMAGSRSWIGGIFNRFGNRRNGMDANINKPTEFTLTPLQEERLHNLQKRHNAPFDEFCPVHQEALRALWELAFPDIELRGLVSEQWKDMGWQGSNPSTDFRGCGFISLENLLFLARKYPDSFHRLLFKKEGKRAVWEYPFAVAGINVSFMLIQMLDLCSEKPKCPPGISFVKLLGEDEEAFDILYCIAFAMMDAQWLAMRASYMEFNEVLRVTRMQLERELCLEDIQRMQDLPAYNLLLY